MNESVMKAFATGHRRARTVLMTSRSLNDSLLLLALVTTGCGGKVPLGVIDGDGGSETGSTTHTEHTEAGTDAKRNRDTGADVGPGAESGSETGTGNGFKPITLYNGGPSFDSDGAIATDGTNVYWVAGGGSPSELMFCPTGCVDTFGPDATAGCPNQASVLWSGLNWGFGVGELAISAGRIFFQGAGTDGDANGPLLTCPTNSAAGCGAGPTTFATVSSVSLFSPSLATDDVNLYWADTNNIYACPLGDTCPAPRTVAGLPSGSELIELVPSLTSLYWVNIASSELETVPTSGGPVSAVCTVPGAATVSLPGDGYAYVSGSLEIGGVAGVFRCPLSGGNGPERFAADDGAETVLASGAGVMWLSLWDGAQPYTIRSCAPGATCPNWTDLVGPISMPNIGNGFTVGGNYLYWVGSVVGALQIQPNPP
jgi:hypothetical protein